jgi:hypothetical protein
MKKVFLNREALLAKPKLAIEKVEISNGYVFVREMTGFEKDQWEQSLMKTAPNGNMQGQPKVNYDLSNFRAKIAVSTLCDEEGNLLFSMNDIILLNKSLKASDLEKIVEKAQAINGVSEKDKQEMLKNLEAGQGEGSNSSFAENLG